MKNLKRSILAMLLVVVLIASSIVPVSAAGTQPSKYSTTNNSGTRHVVCTTLDGTSAASYYTGSYTYDRLEELSASTLLTTLRGLMTSTHKYKSSYANCRDYANKTDCENGNGKISLIYTGYFATMSQWNGWNREHVWPQSLGGGNTSGGGADLHHIRPSDAVVNSTRGNKKYGEADGGKAVNGNNPATGVLGGYTVGNYFEPLDNVKGDIARICLYVYVRWGSDWGADSITEVFQSVDVLLAWCEMDPVDTWEMGRNEVVEDIQGNRNVFIDYPEYAWLIFGREVPYDMVTPSGEAMSDNGCEHLYTSIRNQSEPTCGVAGYTGDTYCDDCGRRVSLGTSIAATGNHNTYIKNQSEPTCGKNGNTGDTYCYDCGKKVASGTSIPATGDHSTAIRNKVDATCGSAGYSGDTYCLICSLVTIKGSTIPATGLHSYSAWSINYDAGNKTRTCSGCGKIETAPISAAECAHPSTDIRNKKDATCGADGYTGDDCCVSCNEILRQGEVIPATGNHNYSEMIVVVEPGFLAEGEGKHVCHNCGDEIIVTIPAISTGLESMTVEELLAYVDSDAEKILILLALSSGDRLFLESLVN